VAVNLGNVIKTSPVKLLLPDSERAKNDDTAAMSTYPCATSSPPARLHILCRSSAPRTRSRRPFPSGLIKPAPDTAKSALCRLHSLETLLRVTAIPPSDHGGCRTNCLAEGAGGRRGGVHRIIIINIVIITIIHVSRVVNIILFAGMV